MMAMLISDPERPSPKVWQPWYIDESDGLRKTLPSRVSREQRNRDRMVLQKPHRRTSSPPSPIVEEFGAGRVRLHHSETHMGNPYHPCIQEDGPLDMSIKRRSPPPAHTPTPPLPPPPAHTLNHSNSPPPLHPLPAHMAAVSSPPPPYASWTSRGRPTVITCAAPWYLPTPTHASLPPPPSYDVAAAHLRGHRKETLVSDEAGHTTPTVALEGLPDSPDSDADASRRHILQAGPVDPDIDEHFRRSLGRNYQDLFVTDPPTDQQHDSNDSVDDHFTKALGATWTKLKAERERATPVSLNCSRVSPSPGGTPSPTGSLLAHSNVPPVLAPMRSQSFSQTPPNVRSVVARGLVIGHSNPSSALPSTTSVPGEDPDYRGPSGSQWVEKFISSRT